MHTNIRAIFFIDSEWRNIEPLKGDYKSLRLGRSNGNDPEVVRVNVHFLIVYICYSGQVKDIALPLLYIDELMNRHYGGLVSVQK